MDYLKQWIGKTETQSDRITPVPIAALSATLDRDDGAPLPGDALPPLWHWLYFLPIHRQSEIGADGHPKRGGFLPPVPLPRRMWAGGRMEFLRALRVDAEVTRVSEVKNVTLKEGRSGPLVFVLVRHEIRDHTGVALIEEQDLVYRDQPRPGEAAATPLPMSEDPSFIRKVTPDEVLLFRYSALTFNGHRIHYDYRYATETEGYPGLVVHGPLLATLLADLLRRSRLEATMTHFTFRAMRPIFAPKPFSICGRIEDSKEVRLWAVDSSGSLAMDATATLL